MATSLSKAADSLDDAISSSSKDESGTAPGDRRFRPDVQGLRALAILTVVLYHANVWPVRGGYVGVDVFFVISGFVITGVLLRERSGTGKTSISHFYARRARRILPAAVVVILSTVLATYLLIGTASGNSVADDGRWVAVFLGNYHFWVQGTSYFGKLLPPSPLLNYWSLAVEEQFYIVYPIVFLLCAAVLRVGTLRVRICITLAAIAVTSFWFSVVQTMTHPSSAYFSPFTRAWELALGAMVAVSTPWLKRLSQKTGAVASWTGLGAILASAVIFTSGTPYPGAWVAIPVVGTALAIAGGTSAPAKGAEWLLKRPPFLWLGQRSYSLYLWHWPVLIIAAERVGRSSLSTSENVLLILLVALPLSHVTYHLVENPIRHLRVPSLPTVASGATVVLATWLILTGIISAPNPLPPSRNAEPATETATVSREVVASASIVSLPRNLDPPLADALDDFPGYEAEFDYGCGYTDTVEPSVSNLCTIGDWNARKLIVAYGDSHILMWLPALEQIAWANHWRLIVLGRYSCPAGLVPVVGPSGTGPPGQEYQPCDRWHQWIPKIIRALHPNLVVVSQESLYLRPVAGSSDGRMFTANEWRSGLASLLRSISGPDTKEVVLGNVPVLDEGAPQCLQRHVDDVQACSTSAKNATVPLSQADLAAATSSGAKYIDPFSWFCSTTCSPVIGQYLVYRDQLHITATYAEFLTNVLGQALGFSIASSGAVSGAPAASST